ncbi:MAG: putative sulfate exporter family transporter [Nitrospirae bacterium]|nr:MAG: putative sulfate exporter family transporter [Nitrospirota bacterium]
MLMIVYPIIFDLNFLHLSEVQYGIWAGASIHEVAQVIAAAFGGGEVSGEVGTIIKLIRVAALVPYAFILSLLVAKGVVNLGGKKALPKEGVKFPVFLLGFLAMVMLNSYNFFTPQAVKWIIAFDMFLLTMAMGAMGLETDFNKLLKIGFKPFFLSIFTTLFISGLSLIMVKLLFK